MRIQFTLLLLVLNALVFGLIWLLDQRGLQADENTFSLAETIREEVAGAQQIELSGRAINLPHTLRREDDNWQITQPFKWPANYFTVNRILNQLQFIEEDAVFPVSAIKETGQTLADYGFEDPLLQISLIHERGTHLLTIGTPTEVGNKLYLLGPEQANIYIVNRSSIDSLLLDLNSLRAREIFNLPVFEINALGLQIKTNTGAGTRSFKIRLSKAEDQWQFESPFSASADPALVDSTVNSLSALQVVRFVEDNSSDPVAQGLDDPSVRITLFGNKRERTLFVGNPDPSAQGEATYFARLEDLSTVFTIPAQQVDALRQAQLDLRKRDFFEFQPNEVDSLIISENETELRLQKLETGNWQVVAKAPGREIQPRRADAAHVNTLLRDLSQLRALDFVMDDPSPADLGQLRFNNPQRKVEIQLQGESPRTLTLAHPENEAERLFARSSKAPFIYEVERRSLLKQLSLNPLVYYERRLGTLPAAAVIKALRIEPLDSTQPPVELKLDEAEDRALHADLLKCIRDLRVASYLEDEYKDTRSEEPWAFTLEATILLPDGTGGRETIQRYSLTERLSATRQIGGSPEHDCTFLLTQEMIEALHSHLQAMPLPPEATGETVAPPPLPKPVSAPEATL